MWRVTSTYVVLPVKDKKAWQRRDNPSCNVSKQSCLFCTLWKKTKQSDNLRDADPLSKGQKQTHILYYKCLPACSHASFSVYCVSMLACMPECLSVCVSVCLSVRPSVCMPVFLSVCLSFCHCLIDLLCVFAHMPVWAFVWLSVCLSVTCDLFVVSARMQVWDILFRGFLEPLGLLILNAVLSLSHVDFSQLVDARGQC